MSNLVQSYKVIPEKKVSVKQEEREGSSEGRPVFCSSVLEVQWALVSDRQFPIQLHHLLNMWPWKVI